MTLKHVTFHLKKDVVHPTAIMCQVLEVKLPHAMLIEESTLEKCCYEAARNGWLIENANDVLQWMGKNAKYRAIPTSECY